VGGSGKFCLFLFFISGLIWSLFPLLFFLMAITNRTPSQIIAGDTAEWLLSFADYPAPSWVVSFVLVKAGVKIAFTASASGVDHLIAVAKTVTDDWAAGVYSYQAVATNGDVRKIAETGTIEIVADFAQATAGFDARSQNAKMVDLLSAVIEGRASKTDKQYMIGGRMMITLSPKELRDELDYWQSRLRAEISGDMSRKSGKSRFGNVQVRFT
jgi:hypothetical protein